MAQFGSVRVLGTRGRRFESCHSDFRKTLKSRTPLVQLVERRFPKPDAVGSSPTGRAVFFYIKFFINKTNYDKNKKRYYYSKSEEKDL